VPPSPLSAYRSLTRSGAYQQDAAQARAVQALDQLWQDLTRAGRPGFFARLTGRQPDPARGVWLWGDVGRGKTWLMDLFYESLPIGSKRRIHFHRFMSRVHAFLKSHDSRRDPLRLLASVWATDCRVLCFDEFFVSDIADAMLLAGLLEALFENGVVLVATSNLHPDDLYRDGLQRSRFQPAIELLKRHSRQVHVDGNTDFRLRILERSEIYHCPLDASAEDSMAKRYQEFSGGSDLDARIEVNHREMTARRRGDGVAWFDFAELCESNRGTADYIELSRSFNTVLLSGVRRMDDDSNDAAKRFIALVDEFYERNVKLLITAEAPIGELYRGERLAFEFQRTASRLVEMQSHDYLARPHLP